MCLPHFFGHHNIDKWNYSSGESPLNRGGNLITGRYSCPGCTLFVRYQDIVFDGEESREVAQGIRGNNNAWSGQLQTWVSVPVKGILGMWFWFALVFVFFKDYIKSGLEKLGVSN